MLTQLTERKSYLLGMRRMDNYDKDMQRNKVTVGIIVSTIYNLGVKPKKYWPTRS